MPRRSTVKVVKQPRRSLIGTAARTAVIAGTATAVSQNVSGAKGQAAAQQAATQQQIAELQANQAALANQQAQMAQQAQQAVEPVQQTATPAAVGMSEKIELLKQLGELKAAGILTEEEFEVKKAEILAS